MQILFLQTNVLPNKGRHKTFRMRFKFVTIFFKEWQYAQSISHAKGSLLCTRNKLDFLMYHTMHTVFVHLYLIHQRRILKLGMPLIPLGMQLRQVNRQVNKQTQTRFQIFSLKILLVSKMAQPYLFGPHL